MPVVTLIDPDGVIEREGLGVGLKSPDQFADAITHLLGDLNAWNAASDRCRAFMDREYGEDKVLAAYLDTFEQVTRIDTSDAKMIVSGQARHV